MFCKAVLRKRANSIFSEESITELKNVFQPDLAAAGNAAGSSPWPRGMELKPVLMVKGGHLTETAFNPFPYWYK